TDTSVRFLRQCVSGYIEHALRVQYPLDTWYNCVGSSLFTAGGSTDVKDAALSGPPPILLINSLSEPISRPLSSAQLRRASFSLTTGHSSTSSKSLRPRRSHISM